MARDDFYDPYRNAGAEFQRWRSELARTHEEIRKCGPDDAAHVQVLIQHANRLRTEMDAAASRARVWSIVSSTMKMVRTEEE